METGRLGDSGTGGRQDGHHLREEIAMEGGDHLCEGDPGDSGTGGLGEPF